MVTICGIAGISYGPKGPGAEDWSPTEFAQILFPAMVHRGPHAFGYMYYDGENVVWEKFEGRSDNAKIVKTIEIPDNIVWLTLHVRFATTGSPEFPENNHPIRHDNIIGVHNGVVKNYKSVLADAPRWADEDGTISEVDSEAIFAAIHKYGHRAGLRKLQFDGVAVYCDLDRSPWTLHFGRSKNRPMVFTGTPAGAKLFASEEQIIDATGVDHGPFTHMGTNKLWRLKGGKIVGRVQWRDEPVLRDPVPLTNYLLRERERSMGGENLIDSLERQVIKKPKGKPKFTPSESRDHRRSSEVKKSQMRDGDRWGDQFYFKGKLLTEDEFLEVVNLESLLGDD